MAAMAVERVLERDDGAFGGHALVSQRARVDGDRGAQRAGINDGTVGRRVVQPEPLVRDATGWLSRKLLRLKGVNALETHHCACSVLPAASCCRSCVADYRRLRCVGVFTRVAIVQKYCLASGDLSVGSLPPKR